LDLGGIKGDRKKIKKEDEKDVRNVKKGRERLFLKR